MKSRINLGDRVKDRITGFEGIAIANTRWLRQCDRFLVQPETLHEGKPIEAVSFDEPDLVLVEKSVVPQTITEEVRTGGPRPEPRRQS